MAANLVKTIMVPAEQRKKTTLASNIYYDMLEIYDSKVVGYLNGSQTMTWYFQDYSGIDFVKANMNSQFAQVVFLTGVNSKSRAIGLDLGGMQNRNAMNDTNRILFCSGMFSFGKTNEFAGAVANDIREVFENYREHSEDADNNQDQVFSAADELKKFKELLDMGIVTQEEFDTKKKQLLGL